MPWKSLSGLGSKAMIVFSVTDTDELITAALHNGVGEVEVMSIECLSSHLQGHAFKYSARNSRLQCIYPYRLTYSDGGSPKAVDVMVKAKPDEADILRVYQGLLDKGGITLQRPIADYLRHSDYSAPNLKETVLFRDFEEQLRPFLPRSLGAFIDAENSYTLRLEEMLPPGSVILDPDDDTTAKWQSGFSDDTLTGIARIHSRFHGNYDQLIATGYLFECNTEVMTQATELWQALADFIARNCCEVVTEALRKRHQDMIISLPEWYPEVDRQAKTLLYGDVNPQNLAFARDRAGFTLNVFDWERAVISLPQRDLAEHLIYTLPLEFTQEEAMREIDLYLQSFEPDSTQFLQGLRWMIYDLVINRLPLMMLVNHVAKKRRHSGEAYAKAHRLLTQLPR